MLTTRAWGKVSAHDASLGKSEWSRRASAAGGKLATAVKEKDTEIADFLMPKKFAYGEYEATDCSSAVTPTAYQRLNRTIRWRLWPWSQVQSSEQAARFFRRGGKFYWIAGYFIAIIAAPLGNKYTPTTLGAWRIGVVRILACLRAPWFKPGSK